MGHHADGPTKSDKRAGAARVGWAPPALPVSAASARERRPGSSPGPAPRTGFGGPAPSPLTVSRRTENSVPEGSRSARSPDPVRARPSSAHPQLASRCARRWRVDAFHFGACRGQGLGVLEPAVEHGLGLGDLRLGLGHPLGCPLSEPKQGRDAVPSGPGSPSPNHKGHPPSPLPLGCLLSGGAIQPSIPLHRSLCLVTRQILEPNDAIAPDHIVRAAWQARVPDGWPEAQRGAVERHAPPVWAQRSDDLVTTAAAAEVSRSGEWDADVQNAREEFTWESVSKLKSEFVRRDH